MAARINKRQTLSTDARWYVYELVDPRSGRAFYVGKGTGARIEAHEKEAAKGVKSHKAAVIREIWAQGMEVGRRHVAFFWDEQAAYDAETDRILEYGLDNLTNVLPGGQKAWEQRCIDRSNRAQKPVSPLKLLLSIPGRIAFWIKHTNGGRDPKYLHVSGTNYDDVLNDLSKVAWLQVMPMWMAAATSTEEGRTKLAEAMRPYGLDLQFGAA